MMAAMNSSTICSDYWGSLQLLNPDQYHDDQMMISFQTQQELQEYYSLAMNPDTTYCNINNDPLLFQTYDNDQYSSSSSSDNYYPYLYSPTDNTNLVSRQSPEIFPTPDHHDQYDNYFSSYHYPKRQKITHHPIIHYNNSNFIGHNIPGGYFNGQFVPVSPHENQIQLQQAAAAAPQYANCTPTIKAAGVSQLSAQSLAARERRRRITEKTQELGKLIPGGNKMNTAEMLHSAYNYVQFLQAQVSLLKLMASIDHQQEKKEERLHVEELQVVASPIVQEKLYAEEKCLVSKEFVEILANDHDIQSKPLVKDGIAQLLSTNG